MPVGRVESDEGSDAWESSQRGGFEGKGKTGGDGENIPQRVQVSLSLCIDVPLRDIVKLVEVGCWFEVAHGCGGDEREW